MTIFGQYSMINIKDDTERLIKKGVQLQYKSNIFKSNTPL